MKQHITIDQLNELSQPARQELRKYILKEWSEPMKDQKGNWIHAETTLDEYLLSIGQMIEFLYDLRWNKNDSALNFIQGWNNDGESWLITPEKLCDDLWEAVKEILER